MCYCFLKKLKKIKKNAEILAFFYSFFFFLHFHLLLPLLSAATRYCACVQFRAEPHVYVVRYETFQTHF